jgi:outer membrane protein TolC
MAPLRPTAGRNFHIAPLIFWSTLLLLILTAIRVQAGRRITIEQAVELMRRHNPELSAVREELTIAKGELQKANYLTPYNFEFASEVNYRARSTRSNSQDWRVGFIQEFEIFWQRGLRQQSATFGLQATAANLSDQIRLLEGATRLTFYDALRAREEMALLSELAGLDMHLVQAARTRLDAGEINQVEYNSSQLRYGQSHRALVEGRERYRLQCSSLGRLLGGQAGAEPQPDGQIRLKPVHGEVVLRSTV